MKLFLTSLASATLDLLIPLLSKPANKLSVAYITTAADPYPVRNRPWYDSNRQKLVNLGFQVIDYDIKNKNENSLLAELSPFDIIYVEGGNVFYLLWHMRQSGMDIRLFQNFSTQEKFILVAQLVLQFYLLISSMPFCSMIRT